MGKPSAAQQTKFPPNTGNLLPHKYYTQFKEWYEEMTKPKEEKNPNFFSSFKFEHITPKVKVVREPPPRNRQERDRSRQKGGKRRNRSDSDGKTGRTARRRKKQASTGEQSNSKSRAASSSDSSGSETSDAEETGEAVKRRSRRGKKTIKEIEAERKKKGIPPLKVGNLPSFDSSSSESDRPQKNSRKKKVVQRKDETKQKGGQTSAARDEESAITSRSPYGRRYSDEISSHSSWCDDDYDEEKRRLHNIRHGRPVGPRRGSTTVDAAFNA